MGIYTSSYINTIENPNFSRYKEASMYYGYAPDELQLFLLAW
jgi:hypothetical protein